MIPQHTYFIDSSRTSQTNGPNTQYIHIYTKDENNNNTVDAGDSLIVEKTSADDGTYWDDSFKLTPKLLEDPQALSALINGSFSNHGVTSRAKVTQNQKLDFVYQTSTGESISKAQWTLK